MNNHQLKSYSTKSIAVLPFVNMSADPDNEYFSDGITEEIINALTTVRDLRVIARTSSFAFKNKNIDVRTIGSQLGVNMVLEGSVRKADEYLKKGLKINDQNYLGYFAKATVCFSGKWDFNAGHRYLTKAMALNPSFTDAEEGLAELYTAIGEFEKAMHHTQNILSLNPLSPNHYYTKAIIHYLSKSYEKAIESLEAALRIDPQFALAIEVIAICYIHLKNYKKLDEFLRYHPQAEQPDKCRALFKLKHPDANINVDLEAVRSKVKDDTVSSLIAWNLYLQVYLCNHELALDMLDKRVNIRSGQFINFINDPFLVPLHPYERFQNIVAAIFHSSNLPNPEAIDVIKTASPKSVLSKIEVENYLAVLSDLLEKEELFSDSNLCLKMLAEKVNLHPNKLSRLLNEHIGKNFNEYINSFRLEAFKKMALDPSYSHLTLLGLAYESGFNSKTVFNAFFKKMEGMTPRAWVKSKSQ